MIAVMIFCLTAYSQDNKNKNIKEMNILIAFFSATGITHNAAERIAKATEGTLYEIEPQQPYTEEDLNWNNNNSRANNESKIRDMRPAIKALSVNVADYDVIYLGFPIWWYTCPTLIYTFMEATDFKGKTVIPFATSGGSTIRKAENDLKVTYPNVHWKAGLLMNNVSNNELLKWINQ
ncbi:flavodoxin [Bacteroidetes oral taxon 274 str. F0058]|nr:flavodoxin [Bacteroidetes oral taxon 274 str. F0058]